jgi:hypothetical protein
MALDIDGDTDMDEGVGRFLEKGKARAKDGELVGPDLRRQDSVDNGKCHHTSMKYCLLYAVYNDS